MTRSRCAGTCARKLSPVRRQPADDAHDWSDSASRYCGMTRPQASRAGCGRIKARKTLDASRPGKNGSAAAGPFDPWQWVLGTLVKTADFRRPETSVVRFHYRAGKQVRREHLHRMAYGFRSSGEPVEGHGSSAGPPTPAGKNLGGCVEVERIHLSYMGTAVRFTPVPVKKFAPPSRRGMGKHLVDKHAKGAHDIRSSATPPQSADGRETACALTWKRAGDTVSIDREYSWHGSRNTRIDHALSGVWRELETKNGPGNAQNSTISDHKAAAKGTGRVISSPGVRTRTVVA